MGTTSALSLVTGFACRLDDNVAFILVGTLLLGSMPALSMGDKGSWILALPLTLTFVFVGSVV